jgi:amidase
MPNDALAQAELVRTGQATPLELVDAAIDRIERLNPVLNAVVSERFERARAEAKGPLPHGPFRGVPFLVKDLSLTMEGEPYYAGTRVLRDIGYRAVADNALARRFRSAGLVVLGRTNTPELGSTITTEPESFGATHNPWDLGRSPGGSSGGSAAAVAAGLVPIAHGTDGGGSIRIPASACGLVGLKPSRGRISPAPEADSWAGAVTAGVISRSMRDTAAMLDHISGYESGDPFTAPPFARPLVAELTAAPRRLRIGVMRRTPSPDVPLHPDCLAALDATVRLLEGLGHIVEDAAPAALDEHEQQSGHFTKVVAVSTAADIAGLERLVGRPLGDADIEIDNLKLAEWGRSVPGPEYLDSVAWLRSWSRRVVQWWTDGFDLLLTPTLAAPPAPLGELAGPGGGRRMRAWLQYTAQFNLTGQPAISLPVHVTDTGLPIGVQFVAAPFREDVLVGLGAQLEAVVGWTDRRPPVAES